MQVDAQEIILLQAGVVNRLRFAHSGAIVSRMALSPVRPCPQIVSAARQSSGRIGRGLMVMPVSPRSQSAPENR